jgi:4-oxalocrotonate tautomerase
MPMITVQMFPGRTAEQKAALVERLTDVFLETCGQPGQSRDGIWVVIDEVPREHWAIGGRIGAAPPES